VPSISISKYSNASGNLLAEGTYDKGGGVGTPPDAEAVAAAYAIHVQTFDGASGPTGGRYYGFVIDTPDATPASTGKWQATIAGVPAGNNYILMAILTYNGKSYPAVISGVTVS
jgi:hypothetical protein